jgi:hypothetical protein
MGQKRKSRQEDGDEKLYGFKTKKSFLKIYNDIIKI